MEYREFLELKIKKTVISGFDVTDEDLNNSLYDFQKYIVKKALKAGKYAIFSDTGTGKTIMQLEWANKVAQYTNLSRKLRHSHVWTSERSIYMLG